MVWLGTYNLRDAGHPATLSLQEGGSGFAGVDPPVEGRWQVWLGTGFVVSESGHVLTNEHVVRECGALDVGRDAWSSTEASVVATNRSADLAILAIDARQWMSAAVFRSNLPLRLGEEIAILGFPGGDEQGPTFTTGVTSTLFDYDGLRELQHNAEVGDGSSGSPIVDRAGHVVGIHSGQMSREPGSGDSPFNVGFGTRGSIVQAFLETHAVPFRQAVSESELPWREIAEAVSSHTVIVRCYK